jgi:chromosome segregation ATPase
MIRCTRLVCAFALLAAASAPNPGSARELDSEQPDGRLQQEESKPPEGRKEWRERLLTANQEVAIAQKRTVTAQKAYATMRHRRRPRGDAKQAVMDEIELSREALTTAQQRLEKLEKAARRAGAPSSWLKFDPAKIEAATQLPASQRP